MQIGRWLGWVSWVLLMAGCAATSSSPPRQGLAAAGVFEGWQHLPLPGKEATEYRPAVQDGRDALAVSSSASASLLRRQLTVDSQDLGRLRFAWKVPALIEGSDMARRDREDAVVRIILSFDGDRSRLSVRDHALSELAHLMTGEPMPYATLMYVWCPTRAEGSVIHNPRTDRIRKLVVESGPARLNRWLDYERDIRADYRQVFGEDPGRLIGVAIMTDSDNTQSQARAWYGPVQFMPAVVASGD